MSDSDKVYKPYKGGQENFVCSNCDIAIYGGIMGSGKSAAAVMLAAEPSMDGNFAAVYLRNNLKSVSVGGGLVDEFQNIYGENIHLRFAGTPDGIFPSGSKIVFEGMNNQIPEDVEEKTKGWQYDLIYFDELTGFEWFTFAWLISRNRGLGKWTGKIRGTCNPKKSHWLRTYLDWYIGIDGHINPERDGVVRYFFQAGDEVEDLVWGNSKLEVYEQCKIAIDERIRRTGGEWENYILSSVFYQGHISDNKAVLNRDSSYLGKVSVMGNRKSQANLEGNWNIDPHDDAKADIPNKAIQAMLTNDPLTNGDRWITADIADEGSNNMVILVWDGFHIIDYLALYHTTPKENADNIISMATKHQIGNRNIIFDANAARYILGYIPESIPFLSNNRPKGLYARMYTKLKYECFGKMTYMINKGMITIAPSVAEAKYPIKNPKNNNVTYVRVFTELTEECQVVKFRKEASGKQRLLTKYEMKKELGRGRSTDIVDSIAMRMYPVLDCENGAEFEESTHRFWVQEEKEYEGETIYDILRD